MSPIWAGDGDGPDLARSLEQVMPADLTQLLPMKSTYALLTNDEGGVRDDLSLQSWTKSGFLVLNALINTMIWRIFARHALNCILN